jgi:hypothetical protein
MLVLSGGVHVTYADVCFEDLSTKFVAAPFHDGSQIP